MENKKEQNIIYTLATIISVLAGALGSLAQTTINDPRPNPYTSDDGDQDRAASILADDREAAARAAEDARLWQYIHRLESRCDANERRIERQDRDITDHAKRNHT